MIENEYINPFHPSQSDLEESLAAIGDKLRATSGPDDEITVKAGHVVVLMAHAMRVKAKAESELARARKERKTK